MADTSSQNPGPTPDRVVRSFWHGQFSPFEALSSFVAAGIQVALFFETDIAGLPDGVARRNARDILDRHVAYYRREFDGPSPALHANHFRYALLETLGGWWVDADVILVATSLPDDRSRSSAGTGDAAAWETFEKSSCPVGQITCKDSSSQNSKPAPGTGRGLFDSDGRRIRGTRHPERSLRDLPGHILPMSAP